MLVRNPWGRKEWTGEWSDQDDAKWTESAQKRLNYQPGDDGAFWMTYNDCMEYLETWALTVLFPPDWFRCTIRGAWTAETAGGCGNLPRQDDWAKNPNFQLTIPEPPMPGMPFKGSITLSQEDVRYTQAGRNHFAIALRIYLPTDEAAEEHLVNVWQWADLETEYRVGKYAYDREVSVCLDGIAPGKYIVVPSTFKPGQQCSFFLTLWTSYAAHLKEIQ